MNEPARGERAAGFGPNTWRRTVLLVIATMALVTAGVPLASMVGGLVLEAISETAAHPDTTTSTNTGPGASPPAVPFAPAVDPGTNRRAFGTPAGPGGRTGILVDTLVWGVVVALAAGACGWLPGRALGRARGRRRLVLGTLVLLPCAMPAYAVFYAWWQAWPAGSWLFNWAVARERVPEVRAATLGLALVAWSWPIVALFVAPVAARGSGVVDAAMRLDGAGPVRRGLVAARAEWPAVVAGMAMVMLLTVCNTTSFDLAQVFSIGNELRAMDATGSPAGAVLAAASPMLALVACGALAAWMAMAPRRSVAGRASGPSPAVVSTAATVGLVVLALGLPSLLLFRGLGDRVDVGRFLSLHAGSLLRSAGLALAVGVAVAALVLLVAHATATGTRATRRVIAVCGIAWLMTALVPAMPLAIGLERAWNWRWDGVALDPSAVYRSPMILWLAGMARTAVIGVLLARWIGWGGVRGDSALAALEPPRTPWATWRRGGPPLHAAVVAGMVLSMVLVTGEAIIAARLAPAGFDPIAVRLLNAMHYQRGDDVIVGLTAVGILGVLAAAIGAWAVARIGGRHGGGSFARVGGGVGVLALATSLALVPGCGEAETNQDGPPLLPADLVIGSSGVRTGSFNYPRAMSVDSERGRVYVIDKTARVQVFDRTGAVLGAWRMPEFENGKPTGVSIGPDGRVYVADTHYHRIMVFDPDGSEAFRFGTYGEGPGEFIYPTDIAFGPDGRLYVSEYGGNDRIQVFDATGSYLFHFGGFGVESGSYNRPQALLFSPDRSRLYISDSCNHRIVVTDPAGTVLEILGGPGQEPGRLQYPYDVTWLDEDRLLVSEFGNNRIQILTVDGISGGVFGGGGDAVGRLKYPWGAERLGNEVFVLDSGNSRMQRAPLDRFE